VYHREGCHLCEDVVASLSQLQEELRYKIKQIDIDEDPELQKKYNVDVPVVMVNDNVIFYHFFDEEALRAALSD
jgi:glutaredoxin